MRAFMIVMGVLITLTFVLGAAAAPASASTATARDASHVDALPVCIALVGGTALLAGGVWLGTLRRMERVYQES